jgi:hypothetical protein
MVQWRFIRCTQLAPMAPQSRPSATGGEDGKGKQYCWAEMWIANITNRRLDSAGEDGNSGNHTSSVAVTGELAVRLTIYEMCGICGIYNV